MEKETREVKGVTYERSENGWVRAKKEQPSKTEQPAQGAANPEKKEYSDEELGTFARKASDAGLKKCAMGGDERMRVAAKREIARRAKEGLETSPTGNPFDDEVEKAKEIDFIEKGKKANVGEIRQWGKEKYQKTVNGWVKVKNGTSSAKSEEKTPEKYRAEVKETLNNVRKIVERVGGFSTFVNPDGKMTYGGNDNNTGRLRYGPMLTSGDGKLTSAQADSIKRLLAAKDFFREEGISMSVSVKEMRGRDVLVIDFSYNAKNPKSSVNVDSQFRKQVGLENKDDYEFVLSGQIDPINQDDWEEKSSSVDWDKSDLSKVGQTIAYMGRLDDGSYGIKYFSPNGKTSEVMKLSKEDYERNLERDLKSSGKATVEDKSRRMLQGARKAKEGDSIIIDGMRYTKISDTGVWKDSDGNTISDSRLAAKATNMSDMIRFDAESEKTQKQEAKDASDMTVEQISKLSRKEAFLKFGQLLGDKVNVSKEKLAAWHDAIGAPGSVEDWAAQMGIEY